MTNWPKYEVNLHAENLTFDEVMPRLFERGFVFSSKRCKNIEDCRVMFPDVDIWYYLQFGYDADCKMVVHASGYSKDYLQSIRLDDFLKLAW